MNEMETMKIPKLALKVSLPMVISMISISLYQIVDTMFVSNIGEDALTTIALCTPIISIITAIGLGTSIGVNSILARTLGENNQEKVKKVILNGIILILISWIVIALIAGLGGVKVFFSFFSKNETIQEYGNEYLSIIAIFSIGTLFQMLFEKIMEAHGKAKLSMIIQFSGAIVNLILDPIFIFGFGFIHALGIKGAAISTVIGQCFGMILGIIFIIKNNMISFSDLKRLKLDADIVKSIYKVGIPTIILEATGAFITLILNKILIGFSEVAVSVWGIYEQLQKFVIIIVYGLNYGMIPIVAYNWGARKKERIRETISFFLKLAICITLIGMLIFLIVPNVIISIYNVSDEFLSTAVIAFRILSIGFVFAGISLVFSATFQAFENGTYSLIVNLSRKIILVLPLIFILKNIIGIYSVWISFTIAEIVTTIIAVSLYRKIYTNVIEKI